MMGLLRHEGVEMSSAAVLGHDPSDRLVVVHVDDIGMSAAANRGALRALAGAATCGSVMVPCPGFDEIAEVARQRKDLDLGVHLTLNAEYESYRWGPVHDGAKSLVSGDGGMWRSSEDTVASRSDGCAVEVRGIALGGARNAERARGIAGEVFRGR